MTVNPGPRVVMLALFALGACDNRACLAQSDLFASARPALIDECCTCLAASTSDQVEAACNQAVVDVIGGGPRGEAPADAGLSPADGVVIVDDTDNAAPCLCEGDVATCRTALGSGAAIVVVGACLEDGALFFDAPCERACKDVLTFDPLTTSAPEP